MNIITTYFKFYLFLPNILYYVNKKETVNVLKFTVLIYMQFSARNFFSINVSVLISYFSRPLEKKNVF